MNHKFVERIKAENEPLFYNAEGSKRAYQLCVRHLSASMSAGLATFSNGYVIPNEVLYIVDFDKEVIEKVSLPIKLVELKSLP